MGLPLNAVNEQGNYVWMESAPAEGYQPSQAVAGSKRLVCQEIYGDATLSAKIPCLCAASLSLSPSLSGMDSSASRYRSLKFSEVAELFGALLRDCCCADLSYMNLSKNSFSHRKARDSLPTFRQFFSSAFSLTHVSLASMKVPPDSLRALFLGLSNNPHITDLHLDISSCELRSAGAGVIQELFPRVSCVGTLDISDNGLDADLLAVIPALSRHPSLKHLMLGKNFNIKG
ncbi:capping protein, Arp2/3 and myosin-I linker protein 3 isoform X1, partial [Lates japonicus]